jgi:hypothetical protein
MYKLNGGHRLKNRINGRCGTGNSQGEPPEKYGTSFCLTELGFVF